MTADRWLPERPFPPYAFLPGRDPHPTRDPRGHSYSEEPEEPAGYAEPGEWRTNDWYLHGVDLYNHGYLWEAHEAWETIWHPAKHDRLQADFLQGLIQCAAASLKIPMGQPRGLAALSKNGTERLERVAQETGGRFMGLDIRPFVAEFRRFALSSPDSADDRPRIELE